MPVDRPEEERDTASLARSIIAADHPSRPGTDQADYPNPLGGFWNILFPFRPRTGSIVPGLIFFGCIALAIVWAVVEAL